MEMPHSSLELFDRATEELYKGAFDEALKLYAISMHDEDVYGSMKGYCAMGITFYLKDNISMAIKCYTACSRFAALKFPELLQDYQAMLSDDSDAKERLFTRCFYLAADWGWSASKMRMAEKGDFPNGMNEQIYRDILMGRRSEDSLSKSDKLQYGQYMLECRQIGYDFIFADFQKVIADRDGAVAELKVYIDEIIDEVKNIVVAAKTKELEREEL